jgi:hypothetical protein
MTVENQATSPAEGVDTEAQAQAEEALEQEQTSAVEAEEQGSAEPGETDPEDSTGEQPAKSERDKTIQKMERRIARKTAEVGGRDEKIRQLEAELAEFKAKPADGEKSVDPEQQAKRLAEEMVAAREALKTAETVMRDGVTKFGKDFEAKVTEFVEDVGPLMDPKGRLHPLLEAVADSPMAAEIMRHVVEDVELGAELYGLRSQARLGRRIAQIESELQAKAKPKPSAAAKPLAPVKPSAAVVADESKLTDAQWAAARKKARFG